MNEREAGSNFVTLPAVLLLFVLFVFAGNAGMTALSVFLFGGFLVSLLAYLWSKYALYAVALETEGDSAQVFPGQTLQFLVRVKNEKSLPLLWLDFVFPTPEQEGIPRFSGRISNLMPHQEIAREYSWTAARRGIIHIHEAVVFSGDGFGLGVTRKTVTPEKGLLFVVYPEVHPVDLSRLPQRSAELGNGGRGSWEDVTLLRTSRDYLPGDAARKINWRLLAGSGRLQVNLYETVFPEQTALILDLAAFSEYEIRQTEERQEIVTGHFYEEALEEMISLTASLITAFAQKGRKPVLVLPRTREQAGGYYTAEDPEQTVPVLLTALAGIGYRGGPAWFAEYRQTLSALTGDALVLTRNEQTARKAELLPFLPEHRVRMVLWEKEGGSLPFFTIGRRELYV